MSFDSPYVSLTEVAGHAEWNPSQGGHKLAFGGTE